MLAIALGVLVLTALVTAGLARRTEVNTAATTSRSTPRSSRREFDSSSGSCRSRSGGRPAPSRAGARCGGSATSSTRRCGPRTAQSSPSTRAATCRRCSAASSAPRRATPTLPDGVTIDDLDAKRCSPGTTQNGRDGNTVFVAEPLAPVGDVTPVLVLAEHVNTRPLGGSGLAVLGAAAIALGSPRSVAAYLLARRMTRPLAAMETTARSIAGGDLSARVDTHRRPRRRARRAWRGRSTPWPRELDVARGHERAFLLSVSHDLRTPLTSIRGYAEAIADGTVDGRTPRDPRRRRDHRREARRLERLVADLLDLARLDAHQFSLHPRAGRRAPGRARRGRGVRPRGRGARRHARRRRAPTPCPAIADPERLAQIVANLVENALKYATTAVAVGVAADDGRRRCTSTTTGPASPRPTCPTSSNASTRPGPARRRSAPGIGLAIVHELAVAMGGDRVRSSPLDGRHPLRGRRFAVTRRHRLQRRSAACTVGARRRRRLPATVDRRPAAPPRAARRRARPAASSRGGRGTLVSVPTTLPPTTTSAPAAGQSPSIAVNRRRNRLTWPRRVDAAHELLAEEAALGERHRVALQERLLRDRRARRCRPAARGMPCSIRHASNAATGSTDVERRRAASIASRPDRRSSAAPRVPAPRATCAAVASGRRDASARDRRRRRRMPATSPVRSTTSAFTRILNRSSDAASCAPRPASQSSHASSPTRTSAEVDVELALRREQQRCAPVAVGRARRGRPTRGLEERERVRTAHDDEAAVGAVDARRRRRSAASSSGRLMRDLRVGERRQAAAAAAAVSNARALLWHSRSSSAGIESATIPAPACTLACAVAPHHRADGDRGVEVAGEVDVADHARVRPALRRARARR